MLLPIDTELSKAVIMKYYGAGNKNELGSVMFQFPPRIVNDSKSGNWAEGKQRADEPILYFSTSNAREIRIEWTYIVGEAGGSTGKIWTPNDVKAQVAGLRSYFYRVDQAGKAEELVIRFKMWNHGGQETITCALLKVDIKHGKTIFVPRGGSISESVKFAYPLRTDIGVDLRLWTKGGVSSSSGDADEQKIALDDLATKVPIEWR